MPVVLRCLPRPVGHPLAASSHFSGCLQSWQRDTGGAGDRKPAEGWEREARASRGRGGAPPLESSWSGEPDARVALTLRRRRTRAPLKRRRPATAARLASGCPALLPPSLGPGHAAEGVWGEAWRLRLEQTNKFGGCPPPPAPARLGSKLGSWTHPYPPPPRAERRWGGQGAGPRAGRQGPELGAEVRGQCGPPQSPQGGRALPHRGQGRSSGREGVNPVASGST